jgi:hypothetical protein
LDGPHIRTVTREIEDGVNRLGARLSDNSLWDEQSRSLQEWLADVLPVDDSSIQFGPIGAGLTSDPAKVLDDLYTRFVEHASDGTSIRSRSDEDLLKLLRQNLVEQRVNPSRVGPKMISAPDYEHEFPIVWRNGMLNASEAVSFDLSDSDDILEKANKWLGRAVTLRESEEQFKLVLLLGGPANPELGEYFDRARRILSRMPGEHELIDESDAPALARRIAREAK